MAPPCELKLDSTKLFGREHEIHLVESLRKDPKRSLSHSTVLLHGPAGSGKSSLILSQPWEEQGWLMATGKYEISNLEPYSALVETLNALVEQWILIEQQNSSSKNEANNLTDSSPFQDFQSLLQEVYEVMHPILPNVYALVPTPEVSDCDGENSIRTQRNVLKEDSARGSFTVKQELGTVNCVHASFVRILSCLCQTHPVMLFLDDVHLADKASLDVLGVLATSPQIQGILLALSYQEEPAANSSSCIETLTKLRYKCSSDNKNEDTCLLIPMIHEIHIRDLDLNSVNSMVASIVHRSEADTMSLSKVIHKKTAGNPFFVVQFLRMLKQEEFLHYSFVSFQWEWGDVEMIANNASITSNVADIASRTMQQGCKPSTLIALKVGSCFGKIIPLQVLLEWFEQHYDLSQDGSTCSEQLREVKLEGLRDVLDDAAQLGILMRPFSQSQDQGTRVYMWANDELQKVAYSLIEEKYRPILHRKLGNLLWQMNRKHPEQEWMVFMAAEQMNRYSQTHGSEKGDILGVEVAALCLEAAKLSLSKSALYPAYEMLLAGIKHLGEDKWSNNVHHYNLSLQLFGPLAELAFQLGKREEASNAAKEVESHAKTLEDKFRGQVVALECLISGSDRNYNAGVERAMEILKLYGVLFPNNLLPGQLLMECSKVRRKIPREKWDSILDLPEMTDARTKKIMKLLMNHLASYIMLGQRKNSLPLYWYAALRGLNLSIKHGVCEETAYCFLFLGWAYRSQGKLKQADELGEMGIKIVNRFPETVGSHHAGVVAKVVLGIFVVTRPLTKCMDIFLEAHHIALRTGSSEKATLCVFNYVMSYITVGLPLGPLKSDLIQFEREARQFNLPETTMVIFKIFQQFISNLENPIPGQNPTLLKGQFMDQDEVLESLHGNAHRMTKRDIDSQSLMLALFYGEWQQAEKLLGEVEPFMDSDTHFLRASMRRSTMGLVAFKLSRGKCCTIAKRRLRSMGKKVTKELRQSLKDGNVNALPLYTMLCAEESPSKERYDAAIRACARLGLLHFEAYMCEAAAYFFLEHKDESWAEFYLEQALLLYGEWGAKGKVNQLKQTYPKLLLRLTDTQERVNGALKGRTRYSSEHSDLLKDLNWERLSTSTTSSSAVNMSFTTNKAGDGFAETDGSSDDALVREHVDSTSPFMDLFTLGQSQSLPVS